MKFKKLLIVLLLSFSFIGIQNVYSMVTKEEIRTKNFAFQGNIDVETETYDEAKIRNVYLEHKTKMKKSGKKEYLYVKGSLKNLSKSILAGAVITAKFFDTEGNLIAVERKSVTPNIMRRYRRSKGYFTIKTKYNSQIKLCKLEANWSGKEED